MGNGDEGDFSRSATLHITASFKQPNWHGTTSDLKRDLLRYASSEQFGDANRRAKMAKSLIERWTQSAMQDMFDDNTLAIIKGVSRMAAKQGGESTLANYQLLGKRALIGLGVAIVAIQATTSVVGFIISRKSEEQRIERVVRRVLEEERQNAEE